MRNKIANQDALCRDEKSESSDELAFSNDASKEVGVVDQAQLGLIEALLFAASDPVAADTIEQITALSKPQVQYALTQLKLRYESEANGVELIGVAGKFQLRTKAIFARYVRELYSGLPRRLSGAALETVAIIAYRQPITRADIEKLRGVDVTPTIKTLLDRGLIRIVGYQSTIGQPALFGTTEEFLKLFGLNSLAELPTLRDMREFEKEPGECETVNDNIGDEPPPASASA